MQPLMQGVTDRAVEVAVKQVVWRHWSSPLYSARTYPMKPRCVQWLEEDKLVGKLYSRELLSAPKDAVEGPSQRRKRHRLGEEGIHPGI